MSKTTFKMLEAIAANVSSDLIIDNPAPGLYNVEVKSKDKPGCIQAVLFTGNIRECQSFLEGMKAVINNWYNINIACHISI